MRAGERVPERECGTDDSPARLTHVDRLKDITRRIFPLASEFTAQPPARAKSATIHNHHADPPTKAIQNNNCYEFVGCRGLIV
jgi:hypothetical protein